MLAQVTLLIPRSSSPKNSGKSLLRYNGLLIFGALLKNKNLISNKLILDFLEFVFFPVLKWDTVLLEFREIRHHQAVLR